MSKINIQDKNLTTVKGAIVVVTGCSSGIGLATVRLLLAREARVYGGDIQPSAELSKISGFQFIKTNVASWHDLQTLFLSAFSTHGRIDHVFVNAGIPEAKEYFDNGTDSAGTLLEPEHEVLDVNLKGALNTIKVAAMYLKKNERMGSIVVTTSEAGLLPFHMIDYVASKHALVGVIRAIARTSSSELRFRINGLAPAWTDTSMIDRDFVAKNNVALQSPHVIALQAVFLMCDATRHGDLIYSRDGRFCEVNQVILEKTKEVLRADANDDLPRGMKSRL